LHRPWTSRHTPAGWPWPLSQNPHEVRLPALAERMLRSVAAMVSYPAFQKVLKLCMPSPPPPLGLGGV
jgi:hypothetical protein